MKWMNTWLVLNSIERRLEKGLAGNDRSLTLRVEHD